MTSYLVCRFEKLTLSNLVKESFGADFPNIFKKRQVDYIFRYLKDIGAKSVLLEFDYIDKDYLEDYSRYYVKCFNNYGHKTARLHFFSNDIEHSDINSALLGSLKHTKKLQSSYLGFMVVKPLQKTFIGKTCLKAYDRLIYSNYRKCLVRAYDVDLFGIRLKVESVAFQEQDKVVSACATTAIWSSLHAMSWRSVRGIPACSEITTNAINHIDGSTNMFPNKELSNKQILRALDVEGLRHHSLNLSDVDKSDFFDMVRTHIDSGLPLILGVDVYSIGEGKKLKKLAGHAVTILGYKSAYDGDDAIYIHDDRLGPYARASFVNIADFDLSVEQWQHKDAISFALTLQAKNDNSQWDEPHEMLIPYTLIVATHQKVRLSSEYAVNTCKVIQQEYKNIMDYCLENIPIDNYDPKDFDKFKSTLAFAVKLSEISSFRQEVVNHCYESGSDNSLNYNAKKISFLTKSYARFHWVASFTFDGRPAFRILFDATDIPQGNAVAGIFVDDYNYADVVFEFFKKFQIDSKRITDLVHSSERIFFVSFLNALMEVDNDRSQALDLMYGELRAPLYLKEQEAKDGELFVNENAVKLYEPTKKGLTEMFAGVFSSDDNDSYLIWAVAHDGALIIGEELNGAGHPSITSFKPARISGELRRNMESTGWVINSKSGRYSSSYKNANQLLDNAVDLFRSIFYKHDDVFTPQYFDAHGS